MTMSTAQSPPLDAEEILARILSSDPSFDFHPSSPSEQSFNLESGFIDDDLYDTAHLVEQVPEQPELRYRGDREDESPEENTDYLGVGAKKKTFRIPIENFAAFHTGAQGYSAFCEDTVLDKQGRYQHRKDRRQYLKSDSIEKLDAQELLTPEKKIENRATESKSQVPDSTAAPNASCLLSQGARSFDPNAVKSSTPVKTVSRSHRHIDENRHSNENKHSNESRHTHENRHSNKNKQGNKDSLTNDNRHDNGDCPGSRQSNEDRSADHRQTGNFEKPSNEHRQCSCDSRHSHHRLSTGSTVSSSASSTDTTANSQHSTPVKPKRNSVHYASTSIVSIPSPNKSIEIHRTSKQDTSQALHSLRKRVQIVQDESSLKLLPYTIPRDCATRVAFPAATWDLMMQNFRIALAMDNVFICDHFLGREVAGHLLQELEMLKRSGHFERHMQRSSQPGATNYSCVFLTEPDDSVPRLDGLVLMVYKLARYFTSDWKQTSVQITYYPDGHTLDSIQKQGTNRKLLKCVYFANQQEDTESLRRRSADSGSSAEEGYKNTGRYFIDANNTETVVEAKFDRLLAFWGDSISHRIEACSAERYVINVWMVR